MPSKYRVRFMGRPALDSDDFDYAGAANVGQTFMHEDELWRISEVQDEEEGKPDLLVVRPVEVDIRVGQASQHVSTGDVRGLRGRLTDRNIAEQELRSSMSNAIRRAEAGDDALVEVSEAQHGALLTVIGLEEADRGLSAELAALKKLLQT